MCLLAICMSSFVKCVLQSHFFISCSSSLLNCRNSYGYVHFVRYKCYYWVFLLCFFLAHNYIYLLFLVALGFCCCEWAFSRCRQWGLSLGADSGGCSPEFADSEGFLRVRTVGCSQGADSGCCSLGADSGGCSLGVGQWGNSQVRTVGALQGADSESFL